MKSKVFYQKSLIAIIIVFLFIPFNRASAEQKDFSSNHTFANETLEKLIEVHAYDQNYDQSTAQEMIDRIAVLPESILKETVNKGVKLLFIDFPLTDLPEFEHLQGEIPRGWEHTDSTWDDVPGAGGQTAVARIGFSEPGYGHASINLEFHEFSHAIDHYMLGYSISETAEFIEIHEEEKSKMWPDGSFNTDYMEHVEEYFAETSALYYLGGEHKDNLKEVAPKTFDYIENLPKRILSLENNDSSGVSLAWEEIDEADEYHIYRDGAMIDTTVKPRFIDNTFEEYTLHSYQVQAVDSSGTVVNETYVNGIMTSESTALEKPVNIIGTLTDDFTVALKWDEVVHATTYDIIRNDNIIANVEEPFFIDEMIDENTEYYYEIKAKSTAGESPISTSVTINTSNKNSNLPNVETNDKLKGINWVYFVLIGGIILIGSLFFIGIIVLVILRKKRKSS